MGRHFSQAAEFYDANRPDLAERLLRSDLEEDPRDASALALLALCLVARKQGREAHRAAAEAVRLGPDRAFHHYVMAVVQADSGFLGLRRARQALEVAIALEPANRAMIFYMAGIRLDQGSPADAIAWCDRGLQQDPQNAEGLGLRALALGRLGRHDEARPLTGAALASEPDGAHTHRLAGLTRRHAGDLTAAERHFREALRINPANRNAARELRGIRRHLTVVRSLLRSALRLRLLRPPLAPGRPARPNWALGGLLILGVGLSAAAVAGQPNQAVAYLIVLGALLALALGARLASERWARDLAGLSLCMVGSVLARTLLIALGALSSGPRRPEAAGAVAAGSGAMALTWIARVSLVLTALGTGLFFLVVVCPRVSDQVAGRLDTEPPDDRADGPPGT